MKKRITDEELSAFLDGEAKHPEEIERQIQQSGETAQRYLAMSKISTQVQALPKLSARPGLSGRVAVSLAESKPNRRLMWPVRAAAPVLAAIAFVTFLAVTGKEESASPALLQTAVVAPETVAPTENAAVEDVEVLVAELERRLSTDTSSFAGGSFYAEPELVDELPEEILLALAPPDWLDTFASLDSTQDYRKRIGSLSEMERLILVQLLEEYAGVETLGKPSVQKG